MKKGYYSWFRSLNTSVAKSQGEIYENLNEEKAKKITGAKAEQLASKLSSQGKFAPPERPTTGETSVDDFERLPTDYSGEEMSWLSKDLAAGLRDFQDPAGRLPVTSDPQYADVLASIRSTKIRDSKPVDVNMDGKATANDVAMDASDNNIDGMALPPDRVHPEPWYKTPEEASMAAREMSDYYKSAGPDEDEEDYRRSTPSAGYKIFKEDNARITSKIKRFFSE